MKIEGSGTGSTPKRHGSGTLVSSYSSHDDYVAGQGEHPEGSGVEPRAGEGGHVSHGDHGAGLGGQGSTVTGAPGIISEP